VFKFIIKKVLILLSSLFVIVTVTFFLIHSIPGDPFTDEDGTPKEIITALKQYYGLEDPLYIQYFKYFKNLLKGNLGYSFKYIGRTANSIIAEGFPISLVLGLQAIFVAFFAGITFGSFAAFKRGKWEDALAMFAATIGVSVPSFILAALLQYIFAIKLGWFPVARWGTFSQSVLPTLALAATPTAVIARLIRNNMVEVLQQDYILTAKAKGIPPFQLIYKHALKNGILPVITYLGPLTANIITGSFVIERIFGIPGLGQWIVMSVSNRDYTLITSLTIFYSFILMICIFAVDIVYCLVDPRIKTT
jgi:oligopeptide transport system permease protein